MTSEQPFEENEKGREWMDIHHRHTHTHTRACTVGEEQEDDGRRRTDKWFNNKTLPFFFSLVLRRRHMYAGILSASKRDGE